MNAKIWGIIGGVALVLALLSPLVLGNAKKVEQLFEAAEASYERSDYKDAITKYKGALKESNKLGVKTEHIDKEFTTLANLKIAQCYYELGEKTSDVRHYQSALTHVTEVVLDTQVIKHKEELTYFWAENLYKIGDLDQAEPKFSWLIVNFPNSRWVPKALYTIGEINYQQKNYEESIKSFQKLVDKFPHSEFTAKAELRITKIIPMADKRKSSEESDKDESDRFKPDPELQAKTMYNSARDLKQQGSVNAALQRYTDIVTQYPESQYASKAYVDMGDLYFKMRDSKNARVSYEKALDSLVEEDTEKEKKEIYEKYHSTYFIPQYISDDSKIEALTPSKDRTLATANRLRAQGYYTEAARQYIVFANTNPPAEDVVYSLYWAGRCFHDAAYADVRLFKESINVFRRLIKNHSDSLHAIEAYYRLVLAYTDWANTPGYASEWQRVIDMVTEANMRYATSDNSTEQRFLGRMEPFKKLALEKLEKQDQMKGKVRLEPNGQAVEEETQFSKNDRKKDNETLKRESGTTTEGTKEKHYGQGLTYLDKNQYVNAIAQFKKAINLNPRFKEAYCNLAVAYIEQEAYENALSPLQEAISIDSNFIEAYFNLGIAYLRLGRFEAAINAANAALNIDRNYEPAQDLLDSIAN